MSNLGYVTKIWEPIVAALAVPRSIPVSFAMQFIEAESQGNPCAIGERDKFGPDGNPLEFGIGQIYNSPDYYRHLDNGKGIKSGASRRAYCKYPQTVTRHLTPDEMREQVQDLIDEIVMCQAESGRWMFANAIAWQGMDYWRAVKLYHALPSLVHDGFTMVTKRLGRAPATWAEYRRTFEQIKPLAKYDPTKDRRNQSGLWRALQNAETTGGAVTDERTVA